MLDEKGPRVNTGSMNETAVSLVKPTRCWRTVAILLAASLTILLVGYQPGCLPFADYISPMVVHYLFLIYTMWLALLTTLRSEMEPPPCRESRRR